LQAKVFLTGRHIDSVQAVAETIISSGGKAEAAQVDAHNESAIESHMSEVVEKSGGIDISFNAIGIHALEVRDRNLQGVPFVELALESFSLPIETYTTSHFLTARSAVRQMLKKKSGAILMHTPEPARLGAPLLGEWLPRGRRLSPLSRGLSAEYGAQGIRSICLRSTGLPETETIGIIFGIHAKVIGIPQEQFQGMIESMTHTRRSTTLKELADAAIFAVSDMSHGMTGTVLNVTGGLIVD
jgi:NAD(P)-dependent dehydrogenase (short-subunit alcohol dehydrogenase family)